jgi:peptidoglycan/xylan/chitin deacetylase (PgdA/CDA1 family)
VALSFFYAVLLILLVYTIVPTLMARLGKIGVISSLPKGGRWVSLTFDDGPEPCYTPQILEILERYRIKACFFVVGTKARAYPELIKQIAAAGHTLGNHGYRHRAVCFQGPYSTTREIRETNQAIEEITGEKVRFYRPAWGLFNLCSICYYRLNGLKAILWTFMSWDWSKRATAESIARRVLSRVKDGAIIVLHDSGSTPGAADDAPAQVVRALPVILDGLEKRGLKVVPLEEALKARQPGRLTLKKCVQRLWGIFEWTFRKLGRIRELEEGKNSFYRMAPRRYRGKEWLMPDGTLLKPGNTYLELHINNNRLQELIDGDMSIERIVLKALREAQKELPLLADLLKNNPAYQDVKILFGITLLHRGTERLGFTSIEMKPGLFRTLTGWYERWLLALFHPYGYKALKTYRKKLTPRYLVMTRQELINRYYRPGGNR